MSQNYSQILFLFLIGTKKVSNLWILQEQCHRQARDVIDDISSVNSGDDVEYREQKLALKGGTVHEDNIDELDFSNTSSNSDQYKHVSKKIKAQCKKH